MPNYTTRSTLFRLSTQRPLATDRPAQTLINHNLARFLRSPNPDGLPRVSYVLSCPSAHFNRPEGPDLETSSTSDLTVHQSTWHRRN